MPRKAMATKKEEPVDLAAILARRGGTYFSEDEKREWAEQKHPFMIKAIKKGKSQYGERWELTVPDDGKDRILTIPSHEDRDPTFTALADLVRRKSPQGPVYMERRDIGNGQTWVSLRPVQKNGG